MSLNQSARQIRDLFDRGIIIPSDHFDVERQPDGRVRISLNAKVKLALQRAELICIGGLGGTLRVSKGGTIDVQILAKNPGAVLTSAIYLFSPRTVLIGNNDQTGAVTRIGPFSAGAELIFGITVTDNITTSPHGTFTYKMGPASRNPDDTIHAVVDCGDGSISKVSFEDLNSGGDLSYNDAVIQVSLI